MYKRISAQQRGEIESREFLGDDWWKQMKRDYDELLAYRKSIKGKPDEAQRVVLNMNAQWMEFYDSVLFHSPWLAREGKCVCGTCSRARQK